MLSASPASRLSLFSTPRAACGSPFPKSLRFPDKSMHSSTKLFLFCVVAGGLCRPALAQTPVHWTIAASPVKASAGGKLTVVLSATIDEGWHIYSVTQSAGGPVATEIKVGTGQPFSLSGPITAPKPEVKFDENFQMNVEQHE